MRIALASILLLAAAACGGKSAAEPTDPCKDPCKDKPPVGDGTGTGEEPPHEEHMMTPELTAFHDVLAPLWHAEAGPQRTDDTCAASGQMLDLANSIQNALVPEGVDNDAWSTGVYNLMTSVVALQDACPITDKHPFDPAFEGVHDSFHALLEQMPKE